MRLSKAFELYVNCEILAVGGSLNTCEAYRYAMQAFIGRWGNISIEKVTLRMTRDFSVAYQKSHSISTVRNYLTCLRAVMGLCARTGLDVINPENIKPPKRTKSVPLCIGGDEVERLLYVAEQPMRGYPKTNRYRNVLIIKMLYATGLRIGELCRLNIEDIRNREFTVIGKSKEPRTCYITEEIEEMIGKYLEMRDDNNHALFVSAQTGGKRISPKTVQLMFRRIRKEAHLIGVHPHTLRHSFCTRLLEEGVDIRDTAELMGHQSWNTTKIYTHIHNDRLKNIYDRAIS